MGETRGGREQRMLLSLLYPPGDSWSRADRLRLRRWVIFAASVAVLATIWQVDTAVESARNYTRVTPRNLAHKLADFNTQRVLHPHMGAWLLESEESNASAWRYAVRYTCGARCSGRATLIAKDLPNAQHVVLSDRRCTHLPLLSWPTYCYETHTSAEVTTTADGALYRERAHARCSALRAWFGACSDELRGERELVMRRLAEMLRDGGSVL
ncbi:hypothetical protein JYU34_017617 [Plutella xylostella]|uniref:Uncharacterized protein n=1 Tax=Plutella xylostella TaxID=51655 RepID=A0ABQ7Q1K0_PLUXY|nr:hypothetical protein JYU34_017617 [Plutella xylostella]